MEHFKMFYTSKNSTLNFIFFNEFFDAGSESEVCFFAVGPSN